MSKLLIYLFIFLLAEMNATSLSQLTGKMPQITVKNRINKCLVFFIGENNITLGFGVSIAGGEILVHKKFIEDPKKQKIRFEFNSMEAWAQTTDIHKNVALLKVSKFIK